MSAFPLPHFSTDLSGQVAFVTGTTSGLGKRFAKVLAACGAKVALTGRRVEKLHELAEEIRDDGGICAPIAIDMTDRASIRAALSQAEQELGIVTVLINNAGIPDAQRAVRMTDELIDAVFDTNLVGPWILSCEVAKRLIEHKLAGRIVNIASMAAFNTTAQSAASLYATTKCGVARMTEAHAVEWSRFPINVNCIAPGAFSSEMMDGMLERIGDISVGFPRKRICDPAQMDSTLLYLVSPASECVTGTVIKIDDGQGSR
ncbi:MAG TPA: SDR family NAD(P)-dependent oxidoreductase [Gammaproteobacteria bacterium]|nr:SDR family NAD(P)-dependent oxidoreductase [Gammaproteobacteria bacterium]HIK70515.1 SDR family NAD(P)-dependent oxidoreductase [Pseudomonadales bacterium]